LPTQDFLIEERVEEQKSGLPAQDFLEEERVEEQKSELPTQDFLTEERVEEQKSEFEPSTSAEDKFRTQVTLKEKAAVVKGEINQYHESNNVSEDDSFRYIWPNVLKHLSELWMLKSIFLVKKQNFSNNCMNILQINILSQL
jgi:hypothetical protein